MHRFLDLHTEGLLNDDYRFHALPDACTYVVFDQRDRSFCGVTRLRAFAEELNLGREFHFTNIRLLPGVWQGPRAHGQIDSAYRGELPLMAVNQRLEGLDFARKQALLVSLVEDMQARGLVAANPATERIFAAMDDIHSVADMADTVGLSPRQLQRVLKQTTGFTPHDFLKVLRLQQSLLGEPSLSYADQSHFIHSFRKATGYTPGQYARKFDV